MPFFVWPMYPHTDIQSHVRVCRRTLSLSPWRCGACSSTSSVACAAFARATIWRPSGRYAVFENVRARNPSCLTLRIFQQPVHLRVCVFVYSSTRMRTRTRACTLLHQFPPRPRLSFPVQPSFCTVVQRTLARALRCESFPAQQPSTAEARHAHQQ